MDHPSEVGAYVEYSPLYNENIIILDARIVDYRLALATLVSYSPCSTATEISLRTIPLSLSRQGLPLACSGADHQAS